jgi:hypothetical protein
MKGSCQWLRQSCINKKYWRRKELEFGWLSSNFIADGELEFLMLCTIKHYIIYVPNNKYIIYSRAYGRYFGRIFYFHLQGKAAPAKMYNPTLLWGLLPLICQIRWRKAVLHNHAFLNFVLCTRSEMRFIIPLLVGQRFRDTGVNFMIIKFFKIH